MKKQRPKILTLEDGAILIQRQRVLREEIGDLIRVLQEHQKNCNDATEPTTITPTSSLFDSCKDEMVMNVNIDNKILTDFQNLRHAKKEDIRKTLVGLIEYYSNHDALNLILSQDVLETRQSYIKYTAQLAQYLRANQREYRQVRVQFDSAETRLGIFCRKDVDNTLSKSFINSILAILKVKRSVQIALEDIPLTYLNHHAILKYQLKFELGYAPQIKWNGKFLRIFL